MNKHFIKTLIFALVIYSLISCSISIRNFNNDENSLTLPLTVSATELQRIIESRSLAGVATNTDPLVTNTLVRLTPNYAINAIYATENDSGNYSGNSWANSIAATNLCNKISNITDATPTKVYAVLVAGGTYKPVYVTAPTTDERKISFSMKNHVAVIGGFSVAGSWEMSGDIGIAGNGDNTYSVFGHNSINLTNAVIYGVTVTGGNANGGGNLNLGGGMYNSSSSPRLINVVFAGNNAIHYGGGMYNDNNPNLGPLIVNTIFAGNTVAMNGGQDIAMNLDTTDGENIRIAGSVLGIGGANLTNGIVGVGNTGVLNLTYHGLANGEVELRG